MRSRLIVPTLIATTLGATAVAAPAQAQSPYQPAPTATPAPTVTPVPTPPSFSGTGLPTEPEGVVFTLFKPGFKSQLKGFNFGRLQKKTVTFKFTDLQVGCYRVVILRKVGGKYSGKIADGKTTLETLSTTPTYIKVKPSKAGKKFLKNKTSVKVRFKLVYYTSATCKGENFPTRFRSSFKIES